MKFHCTISGLLFEDTNLPYIPGVYNNIHPIFGLNPTSLLKVATNVNALTDENSYYLTGLAVFNLLNPDWRIHADPSAVYPIIHNFERLINLAFRIPINRRNEFPYFVIDNNNNDFANLKHWLDSIENVFTEWKANAYELSINQKIMRKEAVLERLIGSKFQKHQNRIASVLADWAELAGQFPTSVFIAPGDIKTTTNQYWKAIIGQCFTNSYSDLIAQKIDIDDLLDLHDYLESNIPHGSTHAAILMSKIRKARDVLLEFYAPAKPRLVIESGSKIELEFTTVNNNITAESNLTNPGPEPKERDFKNRAEFIRARLKWQSATMKYRSQNISMEL